MQKYVIALYIRLSIEDYKYDSLSIENQSLVLHEYAASMPDGETLPDGLDILHASSTGRLQTLILHGTSAELEERFAQRNPLFMDFVPLTLEEIFIYELGGADYEVKDIVL